MSQSLLFSRESNYTTNDVDANSCCIDDIADIATIYHQELNVNYLFDMFTAF